MVVETSALFVLGVELEFQIQHSDAAVATDLLNARQAHLKCCLAMAKDAVMLGGRHRLTGLNAKLSPG
jgi:hypothetical protein